MQEQVSFDDEPLILVDADDNILGYQDKLSCHFDDGVLHRAFSIFIFNSAGEVMMQKRSDQKMLWPMFWSNSCCSHPRKGESYEIATQRRLKEELGIETELKYLFKFQYQAKFKDVGSENELCSVYIGKSDEQISVNDNEIAEWKFFTIDELNQRLEKNSSAFTPWFKMEWERIQKEYWTEIENL